MSQPDKKEQKLSSGGVQDFSFGQLQLNNYQQFIKVLGFDHRNLGQVTIAFQDCSFAPGVLRQILGFFNINAEEVTSLKFQNCVLDEFDLVILASMKTVHTLDFECIHGLTGKFMENMTSETLRIFSAKNCDSFDPRTLLGYLTKKGALLQSLDLGLDEDYIEDSISQADQERENMLDNFLLEFNPSSLTSLILHDRGVTPSLLHSFLTKCPVNMLELNLNDVNALDSKTAKLLCEKKIAYLSLRNQDDFMAECYHELSSQGLYLNFHGHNFFGNHMFSKMVNSGCLSSIQTLILDQTNIVLNEDFGKSLRRLQNLKLLKIGELHSYDDNPLDKALQTLLPFLSRGITIGVFDVQQVSQKTQKSYQLSGVKLTD